MSDDIDDLRNELHTARQDLQAKIDNVIRMLQTSSIQFAMSLYPTQDQPHMPDCAECGRPYHAPCQECAALAMDAAERDAHQHRPSP